MTREDVLQGNRDFWSLAGDGQVPVGSATHVIAGGSYETRSMLLDVEAFHKTLDGLSEVAPRFSSASTDVDYSTFLYTGNGTADGVEMLAQKKFGRQTGWVSYTRSRVRYHFPSLQDAWFAADQDQAHELRFVDSVQWNPWTFSGTYTFATGRPFTAPTGLETVTISGLPDAPSFERVAWAQKAGRACPRTSAWTSRRATRSRSANTVTASSV